MRNLLTKLVKAMLFLFILLAFVDSNAQRRYAPVAAVGLSDYQYTIENDVLVSPTVMTFELWLKDTDISQDFELSIIQAGVLVSSSIIPVGGTITVTLIAGSSQLVDLQKPAAAPIWVTGATNGCIKITPKAGPGCGSGTIIAQTGLGTRHIGLKITCSLPFVSNSQANLTFNFPTSPYPTKVFQYFGSPCISNTLTMSASNCFQGSTYQNIFLNPTGPIWIGATSTDWNTATNWTGPAGSVVPLSTDNVIIPTGRARYPVITTFNDVSCSNMTVQTGANVTINSTASLTVAGILTLNGPLGLIIKSDASGTGSLKDNGIAGSGTAKVERYIVGYTTHYDHKYHFLSSPVTGQVIQPEFMLLPNIVDDFYKFNELSNTWINTKQTSAIWNPFFELSFGLGSGYLVSYKLDVTKNFIGILNTTTTSLPLNCTWTSAAAGGAEGWNLVGNPYPSALDWELITKNTVDNALYYYNSADTNYKYCIPVGGGIYLGTGSKNIPAMQGFMVHTTNAAGTITLNNTMRTHEGMGVYNKSISTGLSNYLVLTINGTNSSDQAFVYFTNEATQNFDSKFDAHKLMSMDTLVPMIYTITPDISKLAINSLPPSAASTALPLGFIAGFDGTYSITASELNTFQPDATITLQDLKSGTSQNLMQNPVYTFSGLKTDDHNRFLLHFAGTIGIADQKEINPVKIYAVNKTIYISCGLGLHNGQVMITDLLGQQILTKKLNDQVLNQVLLNVVEGYYIVKVQTDETVKTVKVFIH